MPLRSPDTDESFEGLSPRECGVLADLHHPARRREWIEARRLAKSLIRREELIDPSIGSESISILPIDPEVSLRPRLLLGDTVAPVDVSLTHSSGWVAAGLAVGARIGIDLVAPREVREDRLRPWFTAEERETARIECLHLAELWAMKEAAYKATSGTEAFRPRDYPIRAERGWTCGGCIVVIQPFGRLTLAIASTDPTLFRDAERLFIERLKI